MYTAAWIAVPAVGLAVVWRLVSSWSLQRRATRRLYASGSVRQGVEVPRSHEELWGSSLERWLVISGFRSSGAVTGYLIAQGVALVIGASLAVAVSRTTAVETGVEWLREIPGGIGDFFAPVLSFAPWILFVIVGLLPVTRVRSRRQAIVQEVERDLPIVLALTSTLVESGLGFDAALDRILGSLDPERPLAKELRTFRSESQAGVTRVTSFRRLAHRVDVSSVSTFVSAMIHSELVGGGIAESLRRQADEVWNRRREQAIQRAQTLPTKLAVPLVVCFLPGIFVYTFGPAIAQFLRIADGVLGGAS